MASIRLPIQNDLKTRDTTVDKDSIVSNGFIEKTESGVLYTAKRPGITLEYTGAGTANGGFYYNDKVYVWDTTTPALTPVVLTNYGNILSPWGLWSSGESYTADSDPVVYEDDSNPGTKIVYYPAAPSTGVPPSKVTSPGNILWSPVPFGPTQYYGQYVGQNGPTANSKVAAAMVAFQTFEPFQSCATKAPETYVWREFSGVGPGFFGADSILIQQWNDNSPFKDCSSAFNAGIAAYGNVRAL